MFERLVPPDIPEDIAEDGSANSIPLSPSSSIYSTFFFSGGELCSCLGVLAYASQVRNFEQVSS
ncbi:hypothetical protein DENSPDRAFT_845498 [Dentipellis sp. KUC8613]|nr:hypothetical protein DENSPDRAFT_845498 [Dentipellis sp. KUC8613]